MTIIHQASALAHFLENHVSRPFAFVPTMGALHPGHLALVQMAQKMNLPVVASIFVNPTQFNDPKDFEAYPQTIGADIQKLTSAGCEVLFLPTVSEMYPTGTHNLPTYALGSLETVLEGKYRPGHFQGVCQVVHRLLSMVQPQVLVMGEKDFQQCMVINKLIALEGLEVTLHTCPTLREADGLAMSSRNMRLSPQERTQAIALYKALQFVAANAGTQSYRALEAQAAAQLLEAGFSKVDYISIAHAETLFPVEDNAPLPANARILGAAFLGNVRLIDNIGWQDTATPL